MFRRPSYADEEKGEYPTDDERNTVISDHEEIKTVISETCSHSTFRSDGTHSDGSVEYHPEEEDHEYLKFCTIMELQTNVMKMQMEALYLFHNYANEKSTIRNLIKSIDVVYKETELEMENFKVIKHVKALNEMPLEDIEEARPRRFMSF